MHGAHGIDELSPAGPNLVCEVREGEVLERTIDPLDLGIPRCDPQELRGGPPEANAAAIRAVLAGGNGGRRSAVLLNAAGSVRLVTTHDAANDDVAIAVIDTGIGIAPEDQERVFEDFRQADNSPTREYGGAGLGLAICRRLATMLGGQIALESCLGKGSTFTVTIPRRPRRRA